MEPEKRMMSMPAEKVSLREICRDVGVQHKAVVEVLRRVANAVIDDDSEVITQTVGTFYKKKMKATQRTNRGVVYDIPAREAVALRGPRFPGRRRIVINDGVLEVSFPLGGQLIYTESLNGLSDLTIQRTDTTSVNSSLAPNGRDRLTLVTNLSAEFYEHEGDPVMEGVVGLVANAPWESTGWFGVDKIGGDPLPVDQVSGERVIAASEIPGFGINASPSQRFGHQFLQGVVPTPVVIKFRVEIFEFDILE